MTEGKITLISTDKTVIRSGISILSSYLKKYGYQPQIVYLPSFYEEYPPEILTQLEELCKGSILIGVSTMSHTADKAYQVAKFLKNLNIPLIIGGMHATLNPEENLNYFDYVCIGEGEETLLELVTCLKKQLKIEDIKNICYNKNGVIIKNELRPLIENLNKLPFPDYDFTHQFVLFKDNILPMSAKYLGHGEHNLTDHYLIWSKCAVTIHGTRGCYNSCEYCCNLDLKALYKKPKNYVRIRDVDNLICELKKLKKIFPALEFIWFTDDDFLAKDLGVIKKFSEKYLKEVHLPFMCFTIPTSIDESKLKALISAGLWRIQVGIQTGSENIRIKLYNRIIKNKEIIKNIQILNKYKNFMSKPEYQIINMNPFETEDDLFETIKLLYKLPKPYYLEVFNLIFFPGSRFAKECCTEETKGTYKIDYIDEKTHFKKRNINIYNKLISLLQGGHSRYMCGKIPTFFLKILLKNKKRIYDFKFLINLLYLLPSHRKILFSLSPKRRRIYLKSLVFYGRLVYIRKTYMHYLQLFT